MTMRPVATRSVALCLAFVCSACVTTRHARYEHDPLLDTCASKIVKGKSNRQDVVRLCGAPDLEVSGTTANLQDGTPVARLRRQLRDDVSAEKIRAEKQRFMGLERSLHFDPEEWARLQPFGSAGDRYVTLLYVEIDQDFHQLWLPLAAIHILRQTHAVRQNRLLILIDKRSGTVAHIAYRNEIKTQ